MSQPRVLTEVELLNAVGHLGIEIAKLASYRPGTDAGRVLANASLIVRVTEMQALVLALPVPRSGDLPKATPEK